jgi:DNA-binding response OmpR family regulator
MSKQNHIVLIAEDQENILELITAILGEYSYKLLHAKDGKETLSMVKNHMPDLVLLGVQLPQIDGFEVCASIKCNPSLSHIKVLMLSSQGQKVDFQKAREVGADGYIVKPFLPVDLDKKVKELLHQSQDN